MVTHKTAKVERLSQNRALLRTRQLALGQALVTNNFLREARNITEVLAPFLSFSVYSVHPEVYLFI